MVSRCLGRGQIIESGLTGDRQRRLQSVSRERVGRPVGNEPRQAGFGFNSVNGVTRPTRLLGLPAVPAGTSGHQRRRNGDREETR